MAVALVATGCSLFKPGVVPERFTGKGLEITKDITFPAGAYSVYFQKGEIVDEGKLSVWDTYCKFLLDKNHEALWVATKGQYQITGFNRGDANCSRYDCIDVQDFVLRTLDGPVALSLSCQQQYNIGDGSQSPDLISPQKLKITLGEYLSLKPVSDD
jgi:hypothetical protein